MLTSDRAVSVARPQVRGRMFGGSARRWRRADVLLWIDALVLTFAAVLEGALSFGGVPHTPLAFAVLFPVLVLLLLRGRGSYRRRIKAELFDEIRAVAVATALASMTVLSTRVLLTNDPSAAGQTVRGALFAILCLALGRVGFMAFEAHARARRDAALPTIIIGAGAVGQRAAKRLLEAPQLGLRPIGFLDKTPLENDNGGPVLPVLGASWDIDEVVAAHGVEHAVVAFSTAPHEVLLRVARRCEELGVTVSFVPRLFETMKEALTVEHLGGLPLISREPTDPRSVDFAVKYAIDRFVAGLLLVLLSPVLIALALGTWKSVGRPIFYRQRRVGRDGVEFEMLKFRSMKPVENECDILSILAPGIAPGGVEGQDRRTRFGHFLRRTSADELPQLINVVRGEMSLVGPRPERPEFVAAFERDVPRYGERLRVRAGITGWAQVHGLRGKTSLADRSEWDNYYIDNWSLWLDLKILVLTVKALFRSAE